MSHPSAKIATSLEGCGFQPSQSQRVGDRLQANLSLGQLQQLGRAAKASREGDTTPGRPTVSDFIRVSGQAKDPKRAIRSYRIPATSRRKPRAMWKSGRRGSSPR